MIQKDQRQCGHRGQAGESSETVETRAGLCGCTKGRRVSIKHQESHLKRWSPPVIPIVEVEEKDQELNS